MIGWTLCSGIGAPEVAAPAVDWRLASEIEAFPRAVLQQRFGYVLPEDHNQGDPLLWSDMIEVNPDLARRHGVPLPDLIVAGTPCQSFSVAGLRKGLSDDRGNLTLKFVELCHAIVAARPDASLAVVWENVPGVLSDSGNAFGAFLGGLVGALDALPCPGDGSWPGEGMVQGPRARAAWAILDAQYFGVAQRRRRVFVVVDFGGRVDPAQILLEPESLRGDPPTRGEAGQGIAGTLSARTEGGGGLGTDFELAGGLTAQEWPASVAPTLNSYFGDKMGLEDQHALNGAGLFVPGDVAHALRGEGFDASEDGTGRATPIVPVAFSSKDHGADALSDMSPTLRAGGHDGSHANAGVPPAIAFHNRQDPDVSGAVTHPLGSKDNGMAVAFAQNQRGELRTSCVSPQLTCGGGKPGEGYPAVAIQERAVSDDLGQGPQGAGFRTDDCAYTLEARNKTQAVAFDLRGRDGGAQVESVGETDSLRAADGGSSRSYVAEPWAVRRLTPTECARLQGFPDDHTAITYRGKPASDGPQYKAYGNSMCVNVMSWILRRVQASWEERRAT